MTLGGVQTYVEDIVQVQVRVTTRSACQPSCSRDHLHETTFSPCYSAVCGGQDICNRT